MNYTKQELLDFIDEELGLLSDIISEEIDVSNKDIPNCDGHDPGPVIQSMRMREQKLREIRAYVSNWEPKE